MSSFTSLSVLPNIALAAVPLGRGWGDVTVAVTLVKGERLAAFDTGVRAFMPQAIEPALAALASTLADIDLIVNTHGHWDHIEGNDVLHAGSGAPVWIPDLDADLLPTPPDRRLHDGDDIDLGGLRFRVVATPGHSAGMACLYEPTLRLLVVSDAVQGFGPGDAGLPLYFHSGAQYRASLARLLSLDIATLVLGHEFAWSGPARFVHHGEDARRFIEASLAAAQGVERAVAAALAHSTPADWPDFQRAVVAALAAEPGFDLHPGGPFPRLGKGTLHSELRDRGLLALTNDE